MTRISLFVGWYIVLLKVHIIDRDAEWPKIVQTVGETVTTALGCQSCALSTLR